LHHEPQPQMSGAEEAAYWKGMYEGLKASKSVNTEGESKSMYTNPALPVTVPAYGGFNGYHDGFKPADAALVQSNNLATLAAQIANSNQQNTQFMAQLSKDNALLVSGAMNQLNATVATLAAGGGALGGHQRLFDDVILLGVLSRIFPPTPPAP
jgi:hypothetical protein